MYDVGYGEGGRSKQGRGAKDYEVLDATEDHDAVLVEASIIEELRDRADLAAGTGTVHGRSTIYRPAL